MYHHRALTYPTQAHAVQSAYPQSSTRAWVLFQYGYKNLTDVCAVHLNQGICRYCEADNSLEHDLQD